MLKGGRARRCRRRGRRRGQGLGLGRGRGAAGAERRCVVLERLLRPQDDDYLDQVPYLAPI